MGSDQENIVRKFIHKPSPRMDLLKLNSISNKFISFSKERKAENRNEDQTNNSNATNNAVSVTGTIEKREHLTLKKSINKIPDHILKKSNKPVLFKSLTNTVTYKKIPLKINSNTSGGNLTNKSDI